MAIIYSLVARGEAVLAEYTTAGLIGNFSVVTRVLLKKINPDEEKKLSYRYDKYVFHYVVSDGLIYLCMTDQDFKRVSAFQFLEQIEQRFVGTYGDRAKHAIAFAFNADFQRVMQSCMERFNHDKLAQVQQGVDQVRDVMVQNVERILDRGEHIDLLVDKTDVLDQHAFKFKKQSRALKRSMWCKNVKLMIILFLIVFIILFAIVTAACGGFKYPDCK